MAGGSGQLQPVEYNISGIRAGRTISPDLNSPLFLSDNGRRVAVTGHFGCTRGEAFEIETTVTQSVTGALARGRTQGVCSGRSDQFEAATWVYDAALFAPGPAQACAMLITRSRNRITDVFQWCAKTDPLLTVRAVSY